MGKKKKPFTTQTLRGVLLAELLPKFPSFELGAVAVSTKDGTPQWLVEIKAPVAFSRIFHPEQVGQIVRAKLLAAEIEQVIVRDSELQHS